MALNGRFKRRNMSRAYLEYAGIETTGLIHDESGDDPRHEEWAEQREVYGFDVREVWNLDYSLFRWLFERLSMYDDTNCVNTSYHTFEYDGDIITQQQCIDRMIEGCKIYCLKESYDMSDDEKKKVNDVLLILSLCIFSLWW